MGPGTMMSLYNSDLQFLREIL